MFFSVVDGGTVMIWTLAIVKEDLCITVEAEKKVVAEVICGEFSEPFLGENGIRKMVKFIPVGLDKLFPILLHRHYVSLEK